MFTGLVQATGFLEKRTVSGDAGKLFIRTDAEMPDLNYGESIAVNGTCLTLEDFSGGLLRFHVMAETFRRTNLGTLPIGAKVNLERAMRADGRFGGHIVSGHVDAVAQITDFRRVGSDTELRLKTPEAVAPYLVEKGSICLDGISLTIADTDGETFAVRIIPTTWKETNLRERRPGDELNVEADVIGKYVRAQVGSILKGGTAFHKKNLTMDDLIKAGF